MEFRFGIKFLNFEYLQCDFMDQNTIRNQFGLLSLSCVRSHFMLTGFVKDRKIALERRAGRHLTERTIYTKWTFDPKQFFTYMYPKPNKT